MLTSLPTYTYVHSGDKLTHDFELHENRLGRMRRRLALVLAGVVGAHAGDLESPVQFILERERKKEKVFVEKRSKRTLIRAAPTYY